MRSAGRFQRQTDTSASTCILSGFFWLIAAAATVAVLYICLSFPNAKPYLLRTPDTAQTRLVSMMDAICQGNFSLASEYMLGTPDLGVGQEPSDPLGSIFWEAYESSISYQLDGEIYTTDSGLAQDIRLTCLDFSSTTTNLKDRSQKLLERRIAQAASTSEVYDENNEYREDFVMDVLCDAAKDALREDAKVTTVDLTLTLKYQNGQWWIVAEKRFLDAVFGGILF